MATLTHTESKRLYSWWWGSHISPKNSKWLQENLKDVDIKVKAMIKLIEEDADSFARRAEMYYKKRPELMKLVEEIYRAYRALAERYDHATGALRQAHRTVAEAFPNQIPFVLSDESPGSSPTEAAPHTPEMPPSISFFDSDDSQKDALGMSSQYHDIKRNRAYSEENDALMSKKGLKQLNEMFVSGEEATHAKSDEGRVRKVLNFQDEGNSSECKILQEEVSQLSKENQNLKSQITSESMRADKAEAEVQSLKETISKLNSEWETATLQHQLSLERISNLEIEISRSQEDLKKLNDEMLMVVAKLNTAEERCLLLEKAYESLQLELDTLKQREKEQQEELSKKQEELEKLNILLQDEHLRFMQAEMARLSLEKLHSQSREEVRALALEIQSGIEKLRDMELGRMGLEEELRHLKEENGNLNEQHLNSDLKIINLQNEIIFLKDSKVKLEDELKLHTEEKKVLQQELSCLKEDINDLEQSHHRLTEQVAAANFNVESLQESVKELQNGNAELKEICKRHENEKVVHLEDLKHMEKISEKNMVLENSLSDANAELESLREKIKTLEESCESLSGKISVHLSEKAILVFQVEAISQNMEKLSGRNAFLENSLSDVNVELEGLRGKLKVLEESCQSLSAQKSDLLSEKSTLTSQVEGTIQSLQNLEAKYAELGDKHLNLEREKVLTLHQVMELQDSLKREKGEYETLILSIILSSKSQLSTLENQISLLQEEGRLREEEVEVEQLKVMDAQIEIFILQRCLCDMNGNNSILSLESQKLLEASNCAEKLISDLKKELLIQEKNLTTSVERNEKLREWIQLMWRELCINQDCGSLDGIKDESLLQLTLHEIRDLLNSFSDAQDENQSLLLEKSVIVTVLGQFGLNVMDLTMDKNALERESKLKTEELLVLQRKELELLEINEQLRQDAKTSNQIQEVLKAEMDVLYGQLMDLQGAHGTLQSEICKLLEENQSLSQKLYDLREKKDTVEEENSVILAEAITLDSLCLIFRSSSAEKALELQVMSNDLACLHEVSNDLDEEIRLLTEKLGAVEVENVCLKETVVNMYECRKCLMILEDDLNTTRNVCKKLNLEIESGKNLLAQKDIELLQANQKLLSTQDKNTQLCRNLEGIQLDIVEATVMREELENKIFSLSEDNAQRESEIACLLQANEMLNWELDKLHKEVEELRSTEEHLTSELQKGVDEVKSCEVEIATLLKDIQITTVNATLFEEKLLELLITCESLEISAMVQRERLHEEITLRNANVDELKEKLVTMEGKNSGLKEELNAYLLLVVALWDDITSLEEDIFSLAKHYAPNYQEEQDNQSVALQHSKSSQEPCEYHSATVPAGILELHKLHAKVKALQKMVIDTGSLLKQGTFESSASLETAVKETEVLKSKGNSSQEEEQISKDTVQLENSEEPGTDRKLQKGGSGTSTLKNEQMIKDIQLDLVLSSSQYENDVGPYGQSMTENAGSNDQALDLWETTKGDRNNQMQKASPLMAVHDIEYHQNKVVEEEKSKYPSSELVVEKEIDKLELPKKIGVSDQEWNRRVIEGLSSDAQRLSALQTSVQELKRNMETSEMSNYPTSFEFDTVKEQLKEAEGSIFELIDINSKLTKKADDFSASSDSLVQEQNEIQSKNRRQISERARRDSEKIGRLELELQKIQYILLKLKEEHENKRARAKDGRRVLLSDYLYGRIDNRRQKTGLCGCMRPKTKDD